MLYQEKILFVDDEPNILMAIQRQLHNLYHIETADNGKKAIQLIHDNGPFAVAVVDMRMPGMDGVTLLKNIKEISPDTTRMMLTGNADIATAIQAINEGSIFRFMQKPWAGDQLIQCLNSGIRQYQLTRVEKDILEKTLYSTVKVLLDILSLTNPVSFSKTQRLLTYGKHIINNMQLENAWQYEIALMLSQIGTIVIPTELLLKQYSNANLTDEEIDILLQHPQVSQKLIEKIPRLQNIAKMILFQNQALSELKENEKVTNQIILFGAQLIKISVDLDRMFIKEISLSNAIQDMLSKPLIYLENFVTSLEDYHIKTMDNVIKLITVDKLDSFMVTAQNIEDIHGRVLLAKDQEISVATIEYLKTFSKRVGIKEPFQVKIIKH